MVALIRDCTGGSIDAGEHHSRSLCRTPDEADAEDEHADCQHPCANIGQIDEPIRSPGVGRYDGQIARYK
jgi:hypothetical protein